MPAETIKIESPERADKYIANLFAVLTKLSPGQLMLLYGDLFTETEAVKLAKRLEIARGLLSGQSYLQIQKALGVTANTVAEIQRVLKSAGNGFRSASEWLALPGKSERQVFSSGTLPNLAANKLPGGDAGRSIFGGVLEKLFRFPSQQQKKVFEKN